MAVFHTRDVAAEQTRFIFDAPCDIFLLSRNSLKRSLITIFVGDSRRPTYIDLPKDSLRLCFDGVSHFAQIVRPFFWLN